MVRAVEERDSLAVKSELTVDERTTLPHYRSLYTYFSLDFCRKELPIVSAIVNDERDLPFAAALRSSLPCSSSLSSQT
ncbi:hypothetical protein TIFTF001_021727 [Ficus carica]|uniref:Uncharacterized protein n=1 Tax=Ficus carica TaxID=3494 RepID=A0AA88AI07_FICCA|nr:hypothetical protein TIFTF001_021727 [Ficus carica]